MPSIMSRWRRAGLATSFPKKCGCHSSNCRSLRRSTGVMPDWIVPDGLTSHANAVNSTRKCSGSSCAAAGNVSASTANKVDDRSTTGSLHENCHIHPVYNIWEGSMLRLCWILLPLVLPAQTVDEAGAIFVKHVRPLLK